VAVLNLLSALYLFWNPPRRSRWGALVSGLLVLSALAGLLSPLGASLHRWAVVGRWAPYTVAFEGNSDYGNVAVIQSYDQITLFANGVPVLSAPDPDAATAELLVHLPVLFLEQPPRRVLVIGGGAGGLLQELLRYPLERVDYAEPDPLLIRALREVPTPLTEAELSDPRLHLALEDGRRFVQGQLAEPAARYDVILLNLPYPSTLVLNRFYTQEFLARTRELLSPEGLLVLPAPPARTYVGPALGDLLGCYADTLASVFANLRAIPADELTLWLASPEQALDLEGEQLVRRWEAAGLDTRVLGVEYLAYLLDEQAQASFDRAIEGHLRAGINRDGQPAGLRYGLAYESALLSPGQEPFFRALHSLDWGPMALGAVLLAGLAALLLRRRGAVLATAIASTGLVGMTADLLVILVFQVLYGYVYRQVGLLITAFMAGLSVGGLLMTRWVGRLRRPWRALAWLEGGLALGCAGLAAGACFTVGDEWADGPAGGTGVSPGQPPVSTGRGRGRPGGRLSLRLRPGGGHRGSRGHLGGAPADAGSGPHGPAGGAAQGRQRAGGGKNLDRAKVMAGGS
jgi:spermidine synthase